MAGADVQFVDRDLLCAAVIARAKSVREFSRFEEYPEWPDLRAEPIVKPALLIAPGTPPVDPTVTTFGGNSAEYRFVLTALVAGTDEKAAQRELGRNLWPLVRALRSRRIDDDLRRLALMVRVAVLSTFAPMNTGGDYDYCSQLQLRIQAGRIRA